MAVKSSAILTDFLTALPKVIGDVSSPDPATWLAMGVGDDSTGAQAADHTLVGNAFYVTVTPTYSASYKVVYNHEFTYAEVNGAGLTANTIKEYCVTKNNTEFASGDLMMRAVVDDVVLGVGETYDLTFTLEAEDST